MILGLILFTPIFGCTQTRGIESTSYRVMLSTLLTHDVPEITVAAASQAADKAVFLDAREPAEYDVSHIAGAVPVGYDHFDLSEVKDIPKDQEIIVYCSVGYRSEKVSEQLLAAGYQKVTNLYGGIFEWKNQGHPVVNVY
jgi:rhodanese-related sulfurtransferase